KGDQCSLSIWILDHMSNRPAGRTLVVALPQVHAASHVYAIADLRRVLVGDRHLQTQRRKASYCAASAVCAAEAMIAALDAIDDMRVTVMHPIDLIDSGTP